MSSTVRARGTGSNRVGKAKPTAKSYSFAATATALQAHHASSLGIGTLSAAPSATALGEDPHIAALKVQQGKLTLAQRMGILEAPVRPAPLTAPQWDTLHQQCLRRGDPTLPCPICTEPLRSTTARSSSSSGNSRVLLSCSHVFHKACITSFERFTGIRRCPICRAEGYQKHVIHDDMLVSQNYHATKIQKVWRGYAARRRYFHLLLERHPSLKRAFHYGIVHHLSEQYLQLSERRSREVDDFLEGLDTQRHRATLAMLTPAAWNDIRALAVSRGQLTPSDCTICMQPMGLPPSPPVTVLSCGHCFHEPCVRTFEEYQTKENSSSTSSQQQQQFPRCPVCRVEYVRQPW